MIRRTAARVSQGFGIIEHSIDTGDNGVIEIVRI